MPVTGIAQDGAFNLARAMHGGGARQFLRHERNVCRRPAPPVPEIERFDSRYVYSGGMLASFTLILGFQLVGELATQLLPVRIPGPVIGMLGLFAFLVARGSIPTHLADAADALLRHFSLLFVPAGVGVMLHFRLIGEDWLPIGVALVASTLATIAVTAWVMTRLDRDAPDRDRARPD